MIANHQSADYQVCPVTGRLSVVVPFEPNDRGTGVRPTFMSVNFFLMLHIVFSGEAVHLFAFMCFSSCVGSLNRMPFHIIFSLELGSSIDHSVVTFVTVEICVTWI